MKDQADKRKIVRKLIVMRKAMMAMRAASKAPYMLNYTDKIAIDIGKIAEKHGLLYPLVTKKF